MMLKVALLVALLPLVLGWPMEMKNEDKDNYDMMKEYMMKMMMKNMQEGHHPGDSDGCKEEDKEDDAWKDWAEEKMKKEKEQMAEKMMDEYKKFQAYVKEKKMAEERMLNEQKEKMQMMWQRHQEMKKKEAMENEFKEMVDSFQETKHKYAFKLTQAFVKLCQCSEVTEQLEKMSMFEMENNTDLMANMTSEEAQMAMDNGNMEMLAHKLSKMSVEEKKKVFMAGLIKSMCHGAKSFVHQTKEFMEHYMMNDNEGNPGPGDRR